MKKDQTLRERWNMKRRLVKVLIRKGGGDEEEDTEKDKRAGRGKL